MNRSLISERIERFIIFLFCLLLILLSLVYYKERIIFSDTSAVIMDVLKQDKLIVTTNRFVSAFGQVLPLIAYRLHLSLKTILLLYSLNLMLIPVVFALLGVFWFKETRTAWSILLFYTAMNAMLFYFPVSEFQLGLCFLLFYIGLYEQYINNKISAAVFWILSLFLVPVVVFSHPLSILVMGAWLMWQLFINRSVKLKTSGIAVFMALSYIFKTVWYTIPYEDEKSRGLENFRNFSTEYFGQRLATGFFKVLQDDYFLLPVLLLAAVIALACSRKYFAAVLLPLIVFAFWVLITVSFKDQPYTYYYEHMYQPVSFFIVLAAGRYILPVLKPVYRIPAISLVLVISLAKVYDGRQRMEQRFAWYEGCFRLMDQKGIKKALVENSFVDLGMERDSYWTTFYETLFLSALEGKDKTKSVTIVWNMDESRKKAGITDALLNVVHWPHPVHEFPARYFDIGNTPYTILSDVYPADTIRKLSYPDDGH